IQPALDRLGGAAPPPFTPEAPPAPAAPSMAIEPVAPQVAVEPVAQAQPAAPEHEHNEQHRGVVDSSVRVDVDLLDNLVQLVGELVLTRNQILQRTDNQTTSQADPDLVRVALRLDLVAPELQES